MSTAVMTSRLELSSIADSALKAAARFWFVVAVVGQLIFAFTVASFYGMATVRGDWRAWNKGMAHGYVSGDIMGNFAVAVHLLSAVIVILAGVIQLIPQVRDRAIPSSLERPSLRPDRFHHQHCRSSYGVGARERWHPRSTPRTKP